MTTIIAVMKRLDNILLNALKAVTIVCFVLLTVLIAANVFVRFFPVASMHWFDEIIELLYAYLVFYGAAALWITRGHISVGDWIGGALVKHPRMRHLFRAAVETLVLVFVLIFFYYSQQLTERAIDVTNVFAIPKKVLYSCMPAAGAIMIVYSLRNIAVEAAGIVKPKKKG
jgi:TRAP-type C4-dicarboxylate transport system permease small subunit